MSAVADLTRSSAPPQASARAAPLTLALVASLIAIGVLARLSPLLDFQARLPWQYMSEDGYLMQTIARNMAIGLGMSTAEGTLPTNGVQPLATFFFAGLFALTGGDKITTIALITVFSLLVSLAAAWLYYKLAARLLESFPGGGVLAMFIAAAWLTGPLLIRHSMNGLETGVYYLAIALTLNYYTSRPARESGALDGKERVILGLLLGVTFLARNDAVFFIGGVLVVHLLVGPRSTQGADPKPALMARLVDCLVAGVLSLVVASPWLFYNYTNFGSIIPISGTAQSHSSLLGQNLIFLPVALFESSVLYVPLPSSIERSAPVVLVTIVLVATTMTGLWRFVGRTSLRNRRFVLAYGLYALGVCSYYGLFFGAAHFVSRYLSPQAMFLWLAMVVTVVGFSRELAAKVGAARLAVPAAGAAVLASAIYCAYYQFSHGEYHMHKQVVQWVEANVDDKSWVGAVQTGTLGYFHDRTINLDGKVNPEVLQVIRKVGHVQNYVVDSKIDYLVDWAAIADWPKTKGQGERMAATFDVLVKDEALNLGVLKRKVPVGGPADGVSGTHP